MRPRNLSQHAEYVAGGGIEAVASDLGCEPSEVWPLASNENPHGPSPAVVAAVRDRADTVAAYPKAAHADLTAALADRWEVADEQVWLGPGADGALDYLARATLDPGDAVLVPAPGFAYYAMSARYCHGEVRKYHLDPDDDFEQTPAAVLDAYDGERIVYLTTPHSPTGREFTLDGIATIADGTDPETLVVVDEAYGEYTNRPSAVSLLDRQRADVAVTRTFSKAYGLAGLRVGYAVIPAPWADAYAKVTTPFAVNELACRAGLAALDDDEHLNESVETARWAREYMREELPVPTVPSGANFVLAAVGDAPAVAAAMRERRILIRDCSSFGLPEHVRITCGTEAGTREAVAAMREVVA
ncbi:histidinol-phosphate transaminase [Halobacteriales archaeon SW_7_68_16]|nr:MAG: histidinol-phosphate transaminase [Halobacteriales archaeon SW_7_68_16]